MVTVRLLVKKDDFIGGCSFLLVLVITMDYSISGFLSLGIITFIAVVTCERTVEISSAKEVKT